MSGPEFSLGIDVGGTKTRWILAEDGVPRLDHHVPTLAWRQNNYSDADCFRLRQLVAATFEGRVPQWVVMGANGCNDDQALSRCESTFRRCTGWSIRVVNDAELLAAAGHGRGISLIAGTGSIAVARDRAGRLISAGGWGWLLGDDGGGAGLVRRALREALAAEDIGMPDQQLSEALMESLAISRLLHANERLADAPSAASLARHAPAIFEVAAQGSKAARRVLDDAASGLADHVGGVHRRGAVGPVFAGGGIFESQPQFFNQVSRLIRQRYGLIAFLVRDPPVVGAMKLARACGVRAGRVYRNP
ncbi:BadF/BadG/BcrA/BcrD ATPase family protein [Ensifer adhaerens]|uniref:BadF/BadG/BcrA/BcrD ATPase family protein n=1 Tax=Ensifer adhaerens TaxID=106592 RepID=UPI003D07BAA4